MGIRYYRKIVETFFVFDVAKTQIIIKKFYL